VAAILQTPGEWMSPVSGSNIEPKASESKPEESEEIAPELKGDAEMSPEYLKRLLPVFCFTFQNTMIRTVRKSSLNLIRKMTHYIQMEQMVALNDSVPHLAAQIVEVIANVLDTEEDDDCYLIVLQMISDVMSKGSQIFLEHFARLGVFNKVSLLLSLQSNSCIYF
jgi:E3 ubiquitin-protein ligase HECTD1